MLSETFGWVLYFCQVLFKTLRFSNISSSIAVSEMFKQEGVHTRWCRENRIWEKMLIWNQENSRFQSRVGLCPDFHIRGSAARQYGDNMLMQTTEEVGILRFDQNYGNSCTALYMLYTCTFVQWVSRDWKLWIRNDSYRQEEPLAHQASPRWWRPGGKPKKSPEDFSAPLRLFVGPVKAPQVFSPQ